MQCGVAALAMVCAHYRQNIPVAEIEKYCHPGPEGVSLKGIQDAAAKLGFESAAARVPLKDLPRHPLPAILHWNQNHFVVLYKIKNGRYHIADPAKGKYRLSEAEFLSHWSYDDLGNDKKGIALLLTPDPDFVLPETENNQTISYRFIAKVLRRYRRPITGVIFGLLTGCLLQLIFPFLTQAIVDLGIHHNDIGLIWLILLGELLIVLGSTATDFLRRWLLLHVSMRVNISLVSEFFIKLLKLPMSFFDTRLIGDLLQRIGDHSRVQNFLTSQLLGTLISLLSFLIFGVVLLIYSRLIFLIFLFGSFIYGVWIALFLQRRRVIDYELFEQQAISQNKTYQFITTMQEIKLQDCEQRRRWEWEDTQADLFTVQMKSLRMQQTQEAGSVLINEVKNILITVFAATSVINGQISLGAMLAIQYIVGQLNSPVEQFMQFIYSLQDMKISLERINEVHNGKNEETGTPKATDFSGPKSIRLKNVNFKYDPHALKDTLSDISLDIPEGKVTAIVGSSGSGKTTILKLILGYYPVNSGEIEVGGNPVSDYSMKWWRRHCGVVMQNGVIFSESIERNIAVDDSEPDHDRLVAAARIANIHDMITSLPLQYNTIIGNDGMGLSQGQKQRILIARAVYKNPDFIFMDEATNSLDAENEKAIVDNLAEFYKGKTVVVVAHRLSTVRNADNIIVVDNGRIAESGNHESLTHNKGVYFNLVKNQLELGN